MTDGSVTLRCYSVNSPLSHTWFTDVFNAAAFCAPSLHLICPRAVGALGEREGGPPPPGRTGCYTTASNPVKDAARRRAAKTGCALAAWP